MLMRIPVGRCVVTLADITQQLRHTFEGFTDPRTGKNTCYTPAIFSLAIFRQPIAAVR
jgi:hypothetical protein